MEELQIKFNHIIKEYRQAGVYSPIEQVLGRVKSISSIIEKAQRRGIEIDKIQEKLFDIAGIRLICQFTEDIYTVVKLIKKRKDMTVISEKDYIKNIKESGYRSLHLIIEIPIFLQNEKRRMKVEVQLRTIAMDFWASVEHKLRYKKNIPDSEAEILALELSDCANQLAQLDDKMEQIKKRIVEAEKESAPKGDRKRPLPTIGGMLIKNRINGLIK